MSTWTSRAAALLLLPGCLAAPAGVQQAGGLRVKAPAGFCAAPQARAAAAGGDFLAFAPCEGAAAPVLTATVGAEGSAAGLDLSGPVVAAFVRSEAGRASLSRAGDAASVEVLEVLQAGPAVLIRLNDRAPGQGGLPPGEAWRALLAQEGRLVTLTAAGAGEDREAGLQLIGRFLSAFAAANPS
jgi:hypothetical protein